MNLQSGLMGVDFTDIASRPTFMNSLSQIVNEGIDSARPHVGIGPNVELGIELGAGMPPFVYAAPDEVPDGVGHRLGDGYQRFYLTLAERPPETFLCRLQNVGVPAPVPFRAEAMALLDLPGIAPVPQLAQQIPTRNLRVEVPPFRKKIGNCTRGSAFSITESQIVAKGIHSGFLDLGIGEKIELGIETRAGSASLRCAETHEMPEGPPPPFPVLGQVRVGDRVEIRVELA